MKSSQHDRRCPHVHDPNKRRELNVYVSYNYTESTANSPRAAQGDRPLNSRSYGPVACRHVFAKVVINSHSPEAALSLRSGLSLNRKSFYIETHRVIERHCVLFVPLGCLQMCNSCKEAFICGLRTIDLINSNQSQQNKRTRKWSNSSTSAVECPSPSLDFALVCLWAR